MTTVETPIDLGREYEDLTERQARFVTIAGQHADDFATRAEQHDREASYPAENLQKLHESGYMRLTLPAEFKGEDATLLELALAQERLGQGCASTALGVNMHSFFCGVISEAYRASGDPNLRIPLTIMQSGVTLGGAISESASADPLNHPAGTVERVDGGFKLNGRKVFGSNTPVNPMLFFNGVLEEDGKREVLTFQIPKGMPGTTVIDDWDTMGMRATGSFTIEFKDCVVPEAMVNLRWQSGGPVAENAFAAAFLCWFAPTIAAVYTGIGIAARDFARNAVATRSRLPFGGVKHYPSIQYSIAEMFVAVEAARAFIRRTATRLSDPARRDAPALALAEATQRFCVRQAIHVTDLAMEVTGGAAFFKRLPLERYYRDARAGAFHPLAGYDALELIGKAELGILDNHRPRFL